MRISSVLPRALPRPRLRASDVAASDGGSRCPDLELVGRAGHDLRGHLHARRAQAFWGGSSFAESENLEAQPLDGCS